MRRELLHTPEGVRDIYNGECDKKQRIERELHQTFLSFGYHTIQTPTFEFLMYSIGRSAPSHPKIYISFLTVKEIL